MKYFSTRSKTCYIIKDTRIKEYIFKETRVTGLVNHCAADPEKEKSSLRTVV